MSTLAKTGVNTSASGKKRQINKTSCRPDRGEVSSEEFLPHIDLSKTKLYTEVWQNDNPFSVVFISGNILSKWASCGLSFPKATRPVPYDLVQLNMQSATNIRIEITLAKQRKERNVLSCRPKMRQNSTPSFPSGLLRIDKDTMGKLKSVHVNYFPLGITASDGMVNTDFSLPVYSAVFVELLYVSVMWWYCFMPYNSGPQLSRQNKIQNV